MLENCYWQNTTHLYITIENVIQQLLSSYFMSDTTNYRKNMELLFSLQPSEEQQCLRGKNISG